MMPLASRPTARRRGAAVVFALALTGMLGFGWSALATAQGPGNARATATKPAAEQGVHWSDLRPAQRDSLKPLEREWSGIDAHSKRKWLELSARFPKLTPVEQGRVQERMSAWAKLTPRERGEARINFQEAKELPLQDRQARWKAYEALSPEQKQQLAARGAPRAASTDAGRRAGTGPRNDKDWAPSDAGSQAKSNIVPNPSFSTSPKSVTPTVVQARPGATTTLITKRPSPPRHQHTGMPKIAATPGFVNKATLLPERGPQGAATRSAAAPRGEPAPAHQ